MNTIDDLRTALHSYTPAEPNTAGIIARGRRRRTTRRALTGVAAVVAAIAVGAPLLSTPDHQNTSAAAGAVQSDDGFVYHRVVGSRQDTGAAKRCGYVYEAWYAVDGLRPGRLLRVDGVNLPAAGWTGDPKTLTAQTGCVHKIQESDKFMQGTVGMPGVPQDDGGWSAPNKKFVAALPTTPEALLKAAADDVVLHDADAVTLKKLTAPGSTLKNVYTFDKLIDLISSEYPHLTPQARMTTLQALLLVPGVRNLGPAHDLLGRTGIALAAPIDDSNPAAETTKTILDPDTGAYLGATDGHGASADTAIPVADPSERPTS